jgi:hypothetical protein
MASHRREEILPKASLDFPSVVRIDQILLAVGARLHVGAARCIPEQEVFEVIPPLADNGEFPKAFLTGVGQSICVRLRTLCPPVAHT